MKRAAFLLILPMLAACSEAPPPPAAPKLVRTLKVGVGDTALDGTDRSYSGEVRARIETTLGFRVAGKIAERRVDLGQAVKAGQVLARLDPADAGLQATQAEAQLSLAAAELARYRDLKARNFPELAAYYHDAVIMRGRDLMRRTLQRGIASGEFRKVDVETAIDVIFAPVLMMVIWRYSLGACCGTAHDPRVYLNTHLDLALRGLATPAVSGVSA